MRTALTAALEIPLDAIPHLSIRRNSKHMLLRDQKPISHHDTKNQELHSEVIKNHFLNMTRSVSKV